MGPIQLDQGMAQWQVLWKAILNYIKDLPYTNLQYFPPPHPPAACLPLGP